MKARTLATIRAHALASPTVEVCGFVLAVNGHEQVWPATNIASAPAAFFIIRPEDYLAAEEQGAIVAVYHSHPNGPATPSQGDRTACDKSGVPWVIYSVPGDRFEHLEPGGAKVPLIGREFLWGVHDCGTLLVDYYREKLGIDLTYEAYPEGFWKTEHKPYVQKLQENGFRPVPEIQEHDVLLMQISSDAPNHVAIYIGGGMILQHLQRRLSCRDVYGGYWREVTTHILRHRSLL